MADNTTGREAAGQVQVAEEILNSFLSLAPKKDFDLVNTIFSRRNNRIWIFGAAGIGISIKRWLTERGYTVYSFCDNDPEKVGKAVDGIPCRSFSELRQDRSGIVLIAIWKYFNEVTHQCEEAGVPFWDGMLLSGVVFDTIEDTANFISGNLPKIAGICRKLADSQSAEIYMAAQAARLFRERGAMRHYRSPLQYIEPEIVPMGERETVLICGAGDGVVAAEVNNVTGGTAVIHLFEPDSENFSRLLNSVAHMPNVRCVEGGVGRRSERLPFCGGMGGNATFSLPGDQTADVVSIDDYVKDTGVIPSFITMDIEGWELEALCGAKETILRYRPKLAISLYHRASDFVNIPEFLLKLRPDYKLYVRHYTDSYSDTIAYFV